MPTKTYSKVENDFYKAMLLDSCRSGDIDVVNVLIEGTTPKVDLLKSASLAVPHVARYGHLALFKHILRHILPALPMESKQKICNDAMKVAVEFCRLAIIHYLVEELPYQEYGVAVEVPKRVVDPVLEAYLQFYSQKLDLQRTAIEFCLSAGECKKVVETTLNLNRGSRRLLHKL